MKLELHLNESEITLRISEEKRLYILNHDVVINHAVSLLQGATRILILDMENINHIDSAGFGSLIQLNSIATSMGKKLIISNLSEHALEMFDLLKISDAFDMMNIKFGEVSSAA